MKLSIDDWVDFIKSFTRPDRSAGELWEVSDVPMLEIHLAHKAPEKDESKAKDKAKKAKKGEDGDDGASDQKTIVFSPSLAKCCEFLDGALGMMVASTNEICSLEDDLMHFLPKPGKPNF